jgi:rhodanese-related sulfurtransferase
MLEQSMQNPESGHLVRSVLIICGIGVLLGVSYNYFGLTQPRGRGLPWIAHDPMLALASGPSITAAGEGSEDRYTTTNTDPFAIVVETTDLPEIPAIGRPVRIELDAVELYVDAGAALLIDARDDTEYSAGHIPGAVNLPYERVITDPAVLETLDLAGRPIIAYCGGGECEVSLSLAHELIALGFERVAVYMGGFPEWEANGLRVARGEMSE